MTDAFGFENSVQDLLDLLLVPDIPSNRITSSTRHRARIAPLYKVRVSSRKALTRCGLCGSPTPLFGMNSDPGLRVVGSNSRRGEDMVFEE